MNLYYKKNNKQFNWVVLLLQILLGLLALIFLININDINIKILNETISESSFLYLSIGLLFFLISNFVASIRYNLFFSYLVPFPYLLSLTFFQTFLLTFIPWRLGELGFPILLKQDYDISIILSFGVILIMRIMDFIIITAFVIFIGGYIITNLLYWILIAFFVVPLLLLVLIKLIPIAYRKRIENKIKESIDSLNEISSPRQYLNLFIYSVFYFLSTSIQSLFILKAFSLNLDFRETIFLNGITLISAVLPIHPPGGWGTIDSIQVYVLQEIGKMPGLTIPSILSAHTFYTIIIIVGGFIGWISLRIYQRKSNTGTTA